MTNVWSKMPEETDEQFIYRICAQKESSGMTWPKIAKIINDELSRNSDESTYRKKWGTFKRKQVNVRTNEVTCYDNSCLNKACDQVDELLKIKKQIQDQRR